jgi:hypothetical protein
MRLNLNLKDRLIILNTLLPQYGSIADIELKDSIAGKVQLSASEESLVIYTNVGNNQYEIGFKSVDALTAIADVYFTDEELLCLKQKVEFVDSSGMVSTDTLDTYKKILGTSFETGEYQNSWNESHQNV